MKKAIMCAICEKPRQYLKSYAVRIFDYRLNKVIDYKLPTGTDKEIRDSLSPERKVRVCRACIKRMGYKVKTPKVKI